MYLEQVITPHPLKTIGESPRYLEDAAKLQKIAQSIGFISLIQPEIIDEYSYYQAGNIANQVRKSLWYPKDKNQYDWFPDADISYKSSTITPENLVNHQVADCFGYTILTSEALHKANINHFVAIANNHATILMPKSRSDCVYLLDPLNPKLSQVLLGNNYQTSLNDIKTSVNKENKVNIVLNSNIIALNVDTDTEKVMTLNPWLGTKRSRSWQKSYAEQPYILMRAYEASVGRTVLTNYSLLIKSIENQDYHQSINYLEKLQGLYPEIDERKKDDKVIKRLVTGLSLIQEKELAARAIELYLSSFEKITYLTKQREGDYWRIIAKNTKDKSAAFKAKESYEIAKNKTRSFSHILNKKLMLACALCLELDQVM